MSDPRIHFVCPHCGAVLDQTATWDTPLPDRGDFAVCPRCLEVSVWLWVAEVLTVRRLTRIEEQEADADPGVKANQDFLRDARHPAST